MFASRFSPAARIVLAVLGGLCLWALVGTMFWSLAQNIKYFTADLGSVTADLTDLGGGFGVTTVNVGLRTALFVQYSPLVFFFIADVLRRINRSQESNARRISQSIDAKRLIQITFWLGILLNAADMAINYAALPDEPGIASLIYAIVSTGVEELMLIIAGAVCLTIGLVLNDFGVRVPLWFRFSYAVIGMGGIETARGANTNNSRSKRGSKKRKQRKRGARVVGGGR